MARAWLRPVAKLHKWVGLGALGVLALTALTGAILVFRAEIDRIAAPHLHAVEEAGPPLPLADVVRLAEQRAPGFAARSIDYPRRPGAPLAVHVERAADGAAMSVHIAPMSGRVVGIRTTDVLAILADLHVELAAGAVGATVVGTLGILLLGLLLTGLYVWWPRAGGWRKAFRIDFGGPRARLYHQLHTTTGAGAAVLLGLSAVTGISLTFEAPVRSALGSLTRLVAFPDALASGTPAGRRAIGPDEALAAARARFPDGSPVKVILPVAVDDVFRVKLFRNGQNRPDGQTSVWVDRHDGSIVAWRDPVQFTAGETALSWLRPLHVGVGLGLPARIAVALSGAALLLLSLTSLLIWLRKRGARRRRLA